MYLKSLTLKGFKSFADRSTLALEEGITAIVGPNGSGKSNISDAVLWVLGERNAKHLRGQAMEDVIFAGSSARRATSLAEVELVLDNSDQTLPVDFNEVVITRRMYRTGESEYLINGAPSRRMDVLDILHDTGLGVGTHSIISQGSIDSILASKPEDRRNLIEEAAGVLKHKQRLARSARKLERMDNHVARVNDVVNEVARQLGPLERKAKRAKKYTELAESLNDIKLRLAVDDLRKLQQQHEKATLDATTFHEQLDARKQVIDTIDAENEALQKKIRTENEGAGDLSRKQRQVVSAYDKIESACAIMRDRKRNALTRATEINVALESVKATSVRLEEGLADAKIKLDEAKSVQTNADGRAQELSRQLSELNTKIEELQKTTDTLDADAKAKAAKIAELKDEQALTQESLTNGLARIKVLEGHVAELELMVARSSADAKAAESEAATLEQALTTMEAEEKTARSLVATCTRARESAQAALDRANMAKQSLDAQIDALDELEKKRTEAQGQARIWIEQHKDAQEFRVHPLAKAIKVAPGYESLVELLLGRDMESLLVQNAKELTDLVEALEQDQARGEVSFVLEQDSARSALSTRSRAAQSSPVGHALIDEITCGKEQEDAVYALLGDVVVCDTLEEAIGAHTSDTAGLRFAVKGGSIVFPSGKVVIGQVVGDEDAGILARLRHIEELKANLKEAEAASAAAKAEFAQAEEALQRAQSESLKLSEKLAELKGNVLAARNRAQGALEKLTSNTRELEEAQAKRQEAQDAIAAARPDVARLEDSIASLRAHLKDTEGKADTIKAELLPLRSQASELASDLNEAKLEAAKAAERKAYAEMMVGRQSEDLEQNKLRTQESSELLHIKQVSAKRLESLFGAVEAIAESAQSLARKLDQAANEARTSTSHLHTQTEELRQRSLQAHAAYDEVNQKLSDAKIELARVEMQVESSVAEISGVFEMPLEIALSLPELENRQEMEEEAFRLDKRIANLGTINPDAAEEYDELKTRFDYLHAQLEDLSQAKRALHKIDRMIEGRMRDDFLNTFTEINENFQEVFALLFPGGQAYLALEDPDDLENTGVEVNAQPRGKRISKMSLMSGGEKSLTALALLFALYKTRPTPFYILDEVEAALDDTNLRRLNSFIDAMRQNTQLIMITHQRRTMEMADVLFGVSMQADGVTKVVSQKLDRALEYAE